MAQNNAIANLNDIGKLICFHTILNQQNQI